MQTEKNIIILRYWGYFIGIKGYRYLQFPFAILLVSRSWDYKNFSTSWGRALKTVVWYLKYMMKQGAGNARKSISLSDSCQPPCLSYQTFILCLSIVPPAVAHLARTAHPRWELSFMFIPLCAAMAAQWEYVCPTWAPAAPTWQPGAQPFSNQSTLGLGGPRLKSELECTPEM